MIRGSPSRSLGGLVGVMEKMSVKIVWICWSSGMRVIEGIWRKYSCMATFTAHLPPGLTMPLGGGDPGIIHTGSCLLHFCFDPPSPVVLCLFLSNDRCPPSCWVGSRGRSYVSFYIP